MNPISNQIFSDDFHKFVYQDPNVRIVDIIHPPLKPFILEKSNKTEKDMKKEKPFQFQKKPRENKQR